MTRVLQARLAISLWVVAAGCTGNVAASRDGNAYCTTTACVRGTDCAGGEVCLDRCCSRVCNYTADCLPDQHCADGHCVDNSQTIGEAPVIESVNGTGSVDGASDHAPRHLRDRLVITGQHLANATAQLVPAVGAAYDLVACVAPTDTELQVALPTDIAAGAYGLVIANQAGSCNADLRLLQGEAGSLSASGAEIVVSINNALVADPTLSLRGTLSGKVTTIVAVGSAATPSLRTIAVKGVEQVDSQEAGLYLVVLDLSTHQIYDEQPTVSYRTKQSFGASNAADYQGLVDVLDTLNESHVAIIASAGNVLPMFQNTSLKDKLKDFGASSLIDDVTADQGYMLIGRKGIKEGNGLEQVAGTERSGIAPGGTVAVDGALMGLKRTPPQDARYVNATGDTMTGALTFQANPVFNDNAIPGAKLQDLAVTTAKLANVSVTTAKLGDGAVTLAKIASGSRVALNISPAGCGGFVTNSSSCTTEFACSDCYYGGANYWNCSRSAYSYNTPQSCPTSLIGYMIQ
jgi:hypothetical protein